MHMRTNDFTAIEQRYLIEARCVKGMLRIDREHQEIEESIIYVKEMKRIQGGKEEKDVPKEIFFEGSRLRTSIIFFIILGK